MHTADPRVLHEVISTVGSSLDLEEVLQGVVRLLSDASAVHACFVYLIENGGERLVLRAASEPYAHLTGEIALERGEGLAWWAIENRQPGFIRENALADERVKYVPELEEEKFQSLVSVPIMVKDRDAIGVISMHTEAPREFSESEVDFLVSSASLVGGTIENARLYEETSRRVLELERLTELAEQVSRAASVDELLASVAAGALELLQAGSCALYLLEPADEELRLRASAPLGTKPRPSLPLSELGPELARSGRSARLGIPLVAGDELVGLLQAEGTAEVDLARAVANHAAVALKRIELIERLTEKNLIKDFFEQLAAGRLGNVAERARRLGCDLEAPYLVVATSPADERLERGLAEAAAGSLFDRRDDSTRALLRVPSAGEGALLERIRRAQSELETPLAVGISSACRGATSFQAGFEEARHALIGSTVLAAKPTVMTYDELGPYKYLLRVSLDGGMRDSHRDAIGRLAAYDEERSTSLVRTLEEFLRRQGSISSTSEALYVHPNTLRQRLRRIHELSGLDLRKEDWLLVAIAVKLVRLEQVLGTAGADTPPPSGV